VPIPLNAHSDSSYCVSIVLQYYNHAGFMSHGLVRSRCI